MGNGQRAVSNKNAGMQIGVFLIANGSMLTANKKTT